MEERRSEQRFRIADNVLVYTYRESREGTTGRIVNISANGVAMVVGCALAEGEVVRVDVRNSVVLGTVLSCTPNEKDYSIGVQLLYSMTKTELARILGKDFQSDKEAKHLMKLIADSVGGSLGLKKVQRLLGFGL